MRFETAAVVLELRRTGPGRAKVGREERVLVIEAESTGDNLNAILLNHKRSVAKYS
jgi:hypothetical protein